MDEHQLADAAERLSRTLTPEELDETLRRITRGAVESLPEVHHASITIEHADGRLETAASTDDVAAALDARQSALGEGPAWEAARTDEQVVAADLAEDARFPAYSSAAEAAGVRAQAAVRLFTDGRCCGALNLYSRDRGAFTDLTELADLFARHSSAAAAQARELEVVRATALAAELVGRAVGVAMERYGFTQRGAFAFLTRLAEHHRVETPTVAQALIVASDRRAD
jgi:GAF domain-containing protein